MEFRISESFKRQTLNRISGFKENLRGDSIRAWITVSPESIRFISSSNRLSFGLELNGLGRIRKKLIDKEDITVLEVEIKYCNIKDIYNYTKNYCFIRHKFIWEDKNLGIEIINKDKYIWRRKR